jgi:hypothetical protein
MAQPDQQSTRRQLPGIQGKLFLAKLALAWEALWPALWPPLGVAGLFLAIALFDVLPTLPGWVHAILLVVFAFFFFRFLIRAIRHFIFPGPDAAKRRLERASGLNHRPLTAVDDSLVGGADDAAAAALWQAHQRRMADAVQH